MHCSAKGQARSKILQDHKKQASSCYPALPTFNPAGPRVAQRCVFLLIRMVPCNPPPEPTGQPGEPRLPAGTALPLPCRSTRQRCRLCQRGGSTVAQMGESRRQTCCGKGATRVVTTCGDTAKAQFQTRGCTRELRAALTQSSAVTQRSPDRCEEGTWHKTSAPRT